VSFPLKHFERQAAFSPREPPFSLNFYMGRPQISILFFVSRIPAFPYLNYKTIYRRHTTLTSDGGDWMGKEKMAQYGELISKKFKEAWEELSDDIKWAKDVTEIRLQMEFLEAKQDRLFREYGKAVFLSGQCTGPEVAELLKEIEVIEQELQIKYLQLQKLKAESK
jgi:hypothetical protein